MKSLMHILLTMILLTGCSGYGNGEGDLESWLGALEDGGSLFSYLFNANETSGLSVEAMIYTFESENACTFLVTEGEQGYGPPSFAMIKMVLNQAVAGKFEVITSFEAQDGWNDPRLLASVRFSEVDNWKSGFWVEAVSGSIDVSVVPGTVPDWNAGVGLEGSISVSFPAKFMRTTECMTVQGPDVWQETCTCVDEEGNTSECENQSPGDDCCRWASDERIDFQAGFSSVQCKEMCATAISGVPSPIPYGCGDLN